MNTTRFPSIPVGLLTKLGTGAAALAAIFAGVAAVLDGDHQEETITGIITAAGLLYGVIRARGDQAAAQVAGVEAAAVHRADVVASSSTGTTFEPGGPIA
jgi:hypothetical protein